MRLNRYFSEGAVLSESRPIKIIGFADAGSEISGTLQGKKSFSSHTVTDENGKFILAFPAIKGSYDTYTLTVVSEKETIRVSDILIGKVILGAGQSNLELKLGYLEKEHELQKKYGSDYVRIFDLEYKSVCQAQDGLFWGNDEYLDSPYNGKWVKTSDYEGCKESSGLALIFAGNLSQKLDMPVAVVDVSVGGSGIEHWIEKATSLNYFKKLPKTEGKSIGGCIFRESIYPLKEITFDGMLWYQGESGAWVYDRAFNYRYAVKRLISDYRTIFGKDFPILCVLIGVEKYDPLGAVTVNESLMKGFLSFPDTVVCPIHDLPHKYFKRDHSEIYHSIHITTKEELGKRAADMWFLNFIIGGTYKPALLKKAICENGKIIVTFETFGKKLNANGKIIGFTISDENGRYYPSHANIIGEDSIEIYNPKVSNPKEFAYGFCLYFNECNLFCGDLPVIPFRSNDRKRNQNIVEVPLWVYCVKEQAYYTAFNSENGGAGYAPTWTVGKIFGGKESTVSFSDKGVSLNYKKDDNSYYFYGLSPDLNALFSCNMLARYSFMEFEAETSEDVRFVGITVRDCMGNQYTFPPMYDGCASKGIVVKKEKKNTVTVDLEHIYNCYGALNDIVQKEKRLISIMQFTFRDDQKEEGTITINNINFFN
ncbi:MAG: sialate O-acetylesterase [Candidatus Limousia pullorum]